MCNGLTTRLVEALDTEDDIVLVELIEVTQVAVESKALTGVYIAVEGNCALTAGCNCVDCKLRAGHAVAADKDVGLCGLESDAVSLGCVLLALDHCAGVQFAPINLLTDGADDGVDLDGGELAGADRLSLALLVRLAKLHDFDLETVDLAVLVAEDFNGSVEVAELYAFLNCLCDLFLIGGHLICASAVDDVCLLCADTDSGTDNIHCDIAAADDCDLLAELDFVAEIYLTQEVNAAVNAVEVFARDTELCRLLCADAKEEALVALLAQLSNGDILADLNTHLELDAHLFEDIDLGADDLAVEAE